MYAIIGQKVEQTQKFLSDGTRIPVTILSVGGNHVTDVKTKEKHGYVAMQLGFGERKIANKPQLGQAKKAHLDKAPQFLVETRLTDKEAEGAPEVGDEVTADSVFEAGDLVDVRGKSKGKGFAGGVKRYGFRGGPKTHGQSDRWRAPGSIGSGTTPGRVYRGKRMAGKMGNDMTTLKNLEVVEVGKDFLWIKGLVSGPLGALVVVTATGKKNKRFRSVIKKEEEKAAESEVVAEEQEAVASEAPVEAVETPAQETTESTSNVAEASSVQVEEQKVEEAPSDAKAMEDKPEEEAAVEAPVAVEEKSEEVKEEVASESGEEGTK